MTETKWGGNGRFAGATMKNGREKQVDTCEIDQEFSEKGIRWLYNGPPKKQTKLQIVLLRLD